MPSELVTVISKCARQVVRQRGQRMALVVAASFWSMKTWLAQGVEFLDAVAVPPSRVQTRLLPSKTTLKAAFGQNGVRPGVERRRLAAIGGRR